MRGFGGLLLALSLAEHAAAFAPLHACIGLRGHRAVGAQSARMLVGVPKEVLVTGAGGRTGFLAFTVSSPFRSVR